MTELERLCGEARRALKVAHAISDEKTTKNLEATLLSCWRGQMPSNGKARPHRMIRNYSRRLWSPAPRARARGRAIKPLAPRGSAGAGANSMYGRSPVCNGFFSCGGLLDLLLSAGWQHHLLATFCDEGVEV